MSALSEPEMELQRKTLSRSREFRDEVLESLTRIETKHDAFEKQTTGWMEKLEKHLTSGEACVLGAKLSARLEEHDKQIARLRKPTRRAITAVGLGGVSVIAIIEAVKQIWSAIVK